MKKDKKKMIVISILFIILIFVIGTKGRFSHQSNIPPIEGGWDISNEIYNNDFGKYLIEEKDFDYSDPDIYKIAQDIKGSTSNSYDAIKQTAKYVVSNIRYNSKVSISACYDETASSTLEDGLGDCVSMSRLSTALLRAQGIPARTVGGCLSLTNRCSPLFAMSPLLEAQVAVMMEGDFKKRGFLHEWVEAWDPERGWIVVESTSGQVFPLGCQSYIMYAYDSNRYDRCVITDSNFWNLCSIS